MPEAVEKSKKIDYVRAENAASFGDLGLWLRARAAFAGLKTDVASFQPVYACDSNASSLIKKGSKKHYS